MIVLKSGRRQYNDGERETFVYEPLEPMVNCFRYTNVNPWGNLFGFFITRHFGTPYPTQIDLTLYLNECEVRELYIDPRSIWNKAERWEENERA